MKETLSASLRDRLRKILPNNYPRYVRVYDNAGKTMDRFTVVFTGRYNLVGRKRTTTRSERPFEYYHLTMSNNPLSPQGVCLLDSTTYPYQIDLDEKFQRFAPNFGKSGPLGKRIHWHELPEPCQKAALHAYKEIWDLYPAEAKNGKIHMPRLDN
jgi:hypothetical protein